MKADGSNAIAKVEKAETKLNSWDGWFDVLKKEAATKLPVNTVGVDRFMESAKMALFDPKVPELARCSHDSQKRSILQAAIYGLEIGGVLGQAYLIPYNESVFNKQTKQYEKVMTAHFQLGYKGLITLARRSNTIKTIAAECIHENDIFDCELASGRSIHHKIDIFKDRGEVVGYYCLVELTNGGEQFTVMSKKDAEKFRDTYSKSYIMAKDKSQQNWSKNFDAMALKTCVIKALKLCPISIEALRAVQEEENSDYNDSTVTAKSSGLPSFDKAEAEEVEYTVVDEEVPVEEPKKRGRPAAKKLEPSDIDPRIQKGIPEKKESPAEEKKAEKAEDNFAIEAALLEEQKELSDLY